MKEKSVSRRPTLVSQTLHLSLTHPLISRLRSWSEIDAPRFAKFLYAHSNQLQRRLCAMRTRKPASLPDAQSDWVMVR
jgi:hypothetical protein